MTSVGFGLFVRSMWNGNLSQNELKGSYALGLSGEILEVIRVVTVSEPKYRNMNDREHFAELIAEAGDVAHYVFGMAQLYGFEANDLTSIALQTAARFQRHQRATFWGRATTSSLKRQERALWLSLTAAVELGDLVKKNAFHGKPNEYVAIKVGQLLEVALCGLLVVLSERGVDLDEALDNNYQKLRLRHGDKFTDAAYQSAETKNVGYVSASKEQ